MVHLNEVLVVFVGRVGAQIHPLVAGDKVFAVADVDFKDLFLLLQVVHHDVRLPVGDQQSDELAAGRHFHFQKFSIAVELEEVFSVASTQVPNVQPKAVHVLVGFVVGDCLLDHEKSGFGDGGDHVDGTLVVEDVGALVRVNLPEVPNVDGCVDVGGGSDQVVCLGDRPGEVGRAVEHNGVEKVLVVGVPDDDVFVEAGEDEETVVVEGDVGEAYLAHVLEWLGLQHDRQAFRLHQQQVAPFYVQNHDPVVNGRYGDFVECTVLLASFQELLVRVFVVDAFDDVAEVVGARADVEDFKETVVHVAAVGVLAVVGDFNGRYGILRAESCQQSGVFEIEQFCVVVFADEDELLVRCDLALDKLPCLNEVVDRLDFLASSDIDEVLLSAQNVARKEASELGGQSPA